MHACRGAAGLTGCCGKQRVLEANSIGLPLGQWKCFGTSVVMAAQDANPQAHVPQSYLEPGARDSQVPSSWAHILHSAKLDCE